MNQHFLNDEEIASTMAGFAELEVDETCLEIGPGKGVITKYLCQDAKTVIAIEKDESLRSHLKSLSDRLGNLEVRYGDALTQKWPRAHKIVSNLPFNITEPFFSRLFDKSFRYGIFLIGKRFKLEIDSSLKGEPSTRTSLLMAAYFYIDNLMDVESNRFTPEPSTDTNIIGISPVKIEDVRDVALYLIRFIWSQGNRPLYQSINNALKNLALRKLGIEGEIKTETIVSDLGIRQETLGIRGYDATSQELVEIYKTIKEAKVARKMSKIARRETGSKLGDYISSPAKVGRGVKYR